MEENGFYGRSEWNEQMLFASLYFNIESECRTKQMHGDLHGWKAAVETKISLLMSVVDPTEKPTKKKLLTESQIIIQERNTLMKSYYDFSVVSQKRNDHNTLALKAGMLNNVLFNVDAKVSAIANGHMPFLKTRPEVDFTNF